MELSAYSQDLVGPMTGNLNPAGVDALQCKEPRQIRCVDGCRVGIPWKVQQDVLAQLGKSLCRRGIGDGGEHPHHVGAGIGRTPESTHGAGGQPKSLAKTPRDQSFGGGRQG